MEVKNPYMYNGETMTPKIGSLNVGTKSVYIESYGCAMNFSDSEIVLSIPNDINYKNTNDMFDADLILINKTDGDNINKSIIAFWLWKP